MGGTEVALEEAMGHVRRCLARDGDDFQLLFFAAVNQGRLRGLRRTPPGADDEGESGGADDAAAAEVRRYCTGARRTMPAGDGQPELPLGNLRYLYSVCCDAARAEGEPQRLRCLEEAVARGAWRSRSQRPLELDPSLEARPVWPLTTLDEAGEGGAAMAEALRGLGGDWEAIRADAAAAAGEGPSALVVEGEGLHERGRWRELPLVVFGERNATSCELCPRICALLPPLEALAAAAAGPAVGQIKLSVLEQGTYIKPHVGPDNRRLRAHLPLFGCDGARMRLGDETHRWREREWLVFDDSFEHEVWHEGSEARAVLIVDLPHPQLLAGAELPAAMAKPTRRQRKQRKASKKTAEGGRAKVAVDSRGAWDPSQPGGGSGDADRAFGSLVWPQAPGAFVERHWQRGALLLPASSGPQVPTACRGVSKRSAACPGVEQRGAMASLLDLRGVWRLLRGEALRERQAADRYGGFVKTIDGTMRKESASGHAREGEFADQALRQYLLGNTIVLENLELFHAAIGRLCRALSDVLGVEVNANMYATPVGRGRTFPPHTDQTDIFVLQLAGRKRWQAWYSPVFLSDSAPRTNPAPKPVDATLEAGDVLYLPAFWVHEAVTDAERPSLHLTITPKTQRYRYSALLDELFEALPQHMTEAEPWVYETIPRIRARVELLAGSADGHWLRRSLPLRPGHASAADRSAALHEQVLAALTRLHASLAADDEAAAAVVQGLQGEGAMFEELLQWVFEKRFAEPLRKFDAHIERAVATAAQEEEGLMERTEATLTIDCEDPSSKEETSRSCRASTASALEAALVGESMAAGGAPSVALQRVLAALGELRAAGEVRVAALAEVLGDELAALGLAAELLRRGAELRS